MVILLGIRAKFMRKKSLSDFRQVFKRPENSVQLKFLNNNHFKPFKIHGGWSTNCNQLIFGDQVLVT